MECLVQFEQVGLLSSHFWPKSVIFLRHRIIGQTVMEQIVGAEEKLTLILRLLHCAHPVLDLVWLLRDTMLAWQRTPDWVSQ